MHSKFCSSLVCYETDENVDCYKLFNFYPLPIIKLNNEKLIIRFSLDPAFAFLTKVYCILKVFNSFRMYVILCSGIFKRSNIWDKMTVALLFHFYSNSVIFILLEIILIIFDVHPSYKEFNAVSFIIAFNRSWKIYIFCARELRISFWL